MTTALGTAAAARPATPTRGARLRRGIGLARARVETALLPAVLRLPPGVQRRIAGPPIEREGQILDRETQLLLRMLAVAGPPVEELPVAAGRPRLDKDCAVVGGRPPVGETAPLEVAGATGPLPARLYVPRARVGSSGGDGLLVFFHGGGWVFGSLDSHDAPCRVLAERAGVRVLSVDYRLAPEHPFPAAHDDALAAYRWVVEHAAELGADPGRLAVGGDSAGGNLAAGVALAAAREGLPLRFQSLVYPATDMTRSMASHRSFAEGFYLSERFMDLAAESYLPVESDWRDPRASPLFDEVPAGLAPAHVVTAGFDPLRDEGEAYARKLEEAGVAVELRRYASLIHSFFNVVGGGTSARGAVEDVADRLRLALAG